VLLSRKISIPSGKVLKSLSFHRFASTGCLTPGLTGSKAMLAREPVKSRAHSCSATPEGSLVSDP
jgi:hypothetical protein